MASNFESLVTTGLNKYRFVASLHVQHPTVEPDQMTDGLRLIPKSVKRRGERRRRPDELLSGNWDENQWRTDLEIVAGHDVSEFLDDFIGVQVSHATSFLRHIDDTGGDVAIFIGVFADGLCDFEISAKILRQLGNAGISVRLDYYGVDGSEGRLPRC